MTNPRVPAARVASRAALRPKTQAIIESAGILCARTAMMPLLVAYSCSGFAGLVYEVAWTRLLTLYMGHTVPAASTVAAAFMGGLGLGSMLGGRLAVHLTQRRALWAYAILEASVGAAAILIGRSLSTLTPVLAAAYHNGRSPTLFPLVRLSCCLAVLLLPSMAIGATFPIAVRCAKGATRCRTSAAGRLYAVNTAGAAVGAAAAGFALIPLVGLRGTVFTGVAASLLSVVLAIAMIHQNPRELPKADASPRQRAAESRSQTSAADRPANAYGLAAAVLGVTGFATFVYEIAWTRVFSVIIGPSTYAFAATLTAVIVGLAIGSFLGTTMAVRSRRPRVPLMFTLAATAGVATMASALAGGPVLHLVVKELAGPGQPVTHVIVRHIVIVIGLIAPVAIGLGAAFPLALEVGNARDQSPARRVGSLYALNTVAGVAGALIAGFVSIPAFGLQGTLAAATASLVAAACIAGLRGTSSISERISAALVIVAVCAGMAASPSWDRELLASGAYMYTRLVPRELDIETALKAGTLLYYREGAAATVSVKRLAGELSLAIDGKVDASTSGDMLTQKMLAHLPLLLHVNPRQVAIIGLGSGVTLASALVHPIASVDVVEISPEVIEASRRFSDANHNALDDPRTHLIVGDGRSHLSLSSRRYDVIISEPSNPWVAGVAALFTREFFVAVRDHLAADGVFCQWAHTYSIRDRDLRSVVATFGSVFANGSMWLLSDGDLLLIGSAGRLDGRLEQVQASWRRAGVAADLRQVSMTEPFGFLSMYVGGPEELARFAAGARLQIDDRMALEFSAPFALYGPASHESNTALRHLLDGRQAPPVIARATTEATGAEWRDRAAMMFQATAYDAAFHDYLSALGLDPTDADALGGFVRAAAASHRAAEALGVLRSLTAAHPQSADVWIAQAKLEAAHGRFEDAIGAAIRACRVEPRVPAAFEQLASLYSDAGDRAKLDAVVDALEQLFPQRAGTWYYAASAAFLRGRFPDALRMANRAIELDPQHAAAQNLRGAIRASLGEAQAAHADFENALRLDPRDSTVYTNLGLLEMAGGRRSAAVEYFVEALVLDPASVAAKRGLSQTQSIAPE